MKTEKGSQKPEDRQVHITRRNDGNVSSSYPAPLTDSFTDLQRESHVAASSCLCPNSRHMRSSDDSIECSEECSSVISDEGRREEEKGRGELSAYPECLISFVLPHTSRD